MKFSSLILVATFSFQAFSGTVFIREKEKIGEGTKGFEIRYDSKSKKCIKEFWDGDRDDRASKEVSLSKCKEFIAAEKRRELIGGACKEQVKLVDVKTLFGITAKEELVLDKNCYCFSNVFLEEGFNDTSKFLDFSKCEKEFGEL